MKAKKSSVLPDFGKTYFDHVFAEYDLLVSRDSKPSEPNAALPARIDEILKTYESDRDLLTWGDLYELEKFVLKNEPDDVVRSRASGLRENYREIAGQRLYEAYLQARPPQPDDPAAVKVLRADLGRLLDFLHWAYSMIPCREKVRATILRNTAFAIASCTALALFLYGVWLYKHPLATMVLAVLWMGAMGGFVSLQQRIQNIPTEGDPILSIFALRSGQFSLYLSPLCGAVFALLLFLIFVGGFVSGTVFPEPKSTWEDMWLPFHNPINFGKLLVWSFIAGFAERFVPDTLTSLVARAQKIPAGAPVAPVWTGNHASTDKDDHGTREGGGPSIQTGLADEHGSASRKRQVVKTGKNGNY